MADTRITVALIAYKRPGYLKRAVQALVNCQGYENTVSEVVCSVDDVTGAGTCCYEELCGAMSSGPVDDGPLWSVNGQRSRRGIVGNTILAMKMCFDRGAENVLMLEDDAVLKPDALRLCEWFCDQQFEDVLGFSLAAHGDKGGVKLNEHPGSIAEYNFLTCPFAYVVQRKHWPFLLKNWCCKDYHPCGWSWSMTYAARFASLRFMSPWLSRCENIGREDGTNESPTSWDLSQKGHNFSDGSYCGPYEIVKRLTPRELKEADDWMQTEIDKPQGAKYDGWLNFGCPAEIARAREELCLK